MHWRAGRGFIVRDLPWTVEKLRVIPPFEFEKLGRHRPRRHPEQGARSATWAWMLIRQGNK
jgi:hypothetical protein